MQTIRWLRVILSTVFILLGLVFGTYFYIKEHPPAIVLEESAVDLFKHDRSSEVIALKDFRCLE
ncbi:MAG: hypothetical protein DCF20_01280 [Pseudanabaena sp.]|nr:MAG: hypothetical protein DCF20_01280 [Pseudanabaena sp.]